MDRGGPSPRRTEREGRGPVESPRVQKADDALFGAWEVRYEEILNFLGPHCLLSVALADTRKFASSDRLLCAAVLLAHGGEPALAAIESLRDELEVTALIPAVLRVDRPLERRRKALFRLMTSVHPKVVHAAADAMDVLRREQNRLTQDVLEEG